MINWITKKCQAGTLSKKVTDTDSQNYIHDLTGWTLGSNPPKLNKRFEFKNFKQTMFFMNAVAFLCEGEGHHPDVKLGFNYCEITFTTHDVGGLSENDFICAAKVNQLLV